MIFGIHFRRQARVLASIAGLRRSGLAERLEAMAADLLSKADETEDCPAESTTHRPAHCM